MNTLAATGNSNVMSGRDLAANRIQVQTLQAISNVCSAGDVTFQGGSCLALCYDGVRLSADLDLCTTAPISEREYDGIRQQVTKGISEIYGAQTTLSPLKQRGSDSGIKISRFHVRSVPYDNRPDIPKVDVKVEFADVRRYTSEPRLVRPFFDEHVHLPIIRCECASELVADKVISSTMSRYLRHRDFWDIFFLKASGELTVSEAASLYRQKLDDYEIDADQVATGLARISEFMSVPENVDNWAKAVSDRLVDLDWRRRLQNTDEARAVTSDAIRTIRLVSGGPIVHSFSRKGR